MEITNTAQSEITVGADLDAYSIPGIKSVLVVDPAALPYYTIEAALAGIPLKLPVSRSALPLYGSPSFNSSNDYQNGGRIITQALTFKSSRRLDVDIPKAFIVMFASGDYRLVGSPRPPFPVVARKEIVDGNNRIYEYTVSHRTLAEPTLE